MPADQTAMESQRALIKQDLDQAVAHERYLTAELEKTKAMAHTLFGRLQEVEHWLRQVQEAPQAP
jgi:hypothetical protein